MAFLQEEFGWTRRRAALALSAAVFLFIQPVVFLRPFLDEMDFWAGTFGLALFGLIEIILFAWVFGMERGWQEITRGAEIRIPRVFRVIIQYVTPVYLLFIFAFWTFQDALPTLLMHGVPEERRTVILAARLTLLGILAALAFLVGHAWRRRRAREGRS
jgi:SNF family Na+-dependent transporter